MTFYLAAINTWEKKHNNYQAYKAYGMSSSSQDVLYEFLKKLEAEKIPKEIVEKLQVLLLSQSNVNHNDIINLIEESISQIDND